jgi:hypothetical protein
VTPAPRRPRQKVRHAHRRPAPGHRPRPARIAAARHGSRAAARPARHPRTRHDRLRRRGPPGRRTARTAGRFPPGDPPGRRPAGSSAPAPATTSRTATSTRRWPQPSVTACSPATASAGGGSDARRPDHPGHLPGRQGGAAAVPAGLRLRPAHPGRRPHRRLPDPAALHRGAQPRGRPIAAPDLWPEPERFDPERFAPTAASARHRDAWFPFGGGPRACIGGQFALTEAVVATAVLLTANELRSDAAPVPLTTAITLRPARPVRCEVIPRQPVATAPAAAPRSPGRT